MEIMELLTVSRGDRQVAIAVLVRPDPRAPVAPHAILGEMDLVGRSPAWGSFRRNRTFVEFFTRYMRGELPHEPAVLAEARVKPGDHVYIVDPRAVDPRGEVPFYDIVGWYRSDVDGRPLRETFTYNVEHLLVVGAGLFSGLATDQDLLQAALAYSSPSGPAASAAPSRTTSGA